MRAFIAGCPAAPDCLQMQILHCGGEPNHRDSTPYISCSQDLLWCLLSSAITILRGTASNVQIWFINNTQKHHDLQYHVWQEEHWDNLSSNDIDIAKENAIYSSEVLVYKEIGRERILGVLNLDLNKIQQAPAKFGLWAQETLEEMWSYPFAVCKYFLEHSEYWEDLIDWCENGVERTDCVEDVGRVCAIDAVCKALHPLSRDHIFIGPHMIQMKSELHEMFPEECQYDSTLWFLSEHRGVHKRRIEWDYDQIMFQGDGHEEIIEELMLDVKMEGLVLDHRKMKEIDIENGFEKLSIC